MKNKSFPSITNTVTKKHRHIMDKIQIDKVIDGISESLKFGNIKDKRNSQSSESLANIRRKLDSERAIKKDGLKKIEIFPKLELNYTGIPKHIIGSQYGGINTEQVYNRETDKMRLLFAYRNSEQQVSYTYPGHQCNFERNCTWKWKTDGSNTFFVTTPDGNSDGPKIDADNNTLGELQ